MWFWHQSKITCVLQSNCQNHVSDSEKFILSAPRSLKIWQLWLLLLRFKKTLLLWNPHHYKLNSCICMGGMLEHTWPLEHMWFRQNLLTEIQTCASISPCLGKAVKESHVTDGACVWNLLMPVPSCQTTLRRCRVDEKLHIRDTNVDGNLGKGL